MKLNSPSASFLLAFVLAAMCFLAQPAVPAQALPATGTLEFTAQVIPAGGQPEPVRQLSFYLLRKSLGDIRQEVAVTEPPADMDKFIDSLGCSPEMKDWMKKSRIVDFAGEDFNKKLTPDDVLKVPEFLAAYKNLNGGIMKVALPNSQVKESDRTKNPEKYKREQDKYQKALEQYVHEHPESIDGLDAELGDANPSRRWMQVQSEKHRQAEQRALLLAQTQYLAASTVSDLNGTGAFRDLPAGSYWITALGVSTLDGDQRLQWDVPITVRAGQTARVQLSNLNALPASAAH